MKTIRIISLTLIHSGLVVVVLFGHAFASQSNMKVINPSGKRIKSVFTGSHPEMFVLEYLKHKPLIGPDTERGCNSGSPVESRLRDTLSPRDIYLPIALFQTDCRTRNLLCTGAYQVLQESFGCTDPDTSEICPVTNTVTDVNSGNCQTGQEQFGEACGVVCCTTSVGCVNERTICP